MRGDDEADNEVEEEEVEEEGLVDLEEDEEEGVHAWDRAPPHRLLKKPERPLGKDEARTPRGLTLLLLVVVVVRA